MTRAGLRPIARQTRAYFAAVDRVNGPTAIFDPSKDSGFQLDAPPAPWIDLGWIENFQRTTTSQIEALTGGAVGAVSGQARHALGARVDFEFRDWGKLQMALAGGAEHMNVLATDPSASRAGSGGIPLAAVPLLTGSTAEELVVGTGAVAGFEAGQRIACDVDYAQQVGYVGTGIAGAYVKNPADVRQDVNYVRRVTFNVACIAEVTATSLVLTQALPGGTPAAGASVQQVMTFVDREGGAFLQQWSGLFVADDESGGRVCFFYPILSPCTVKPEWVRESLVEIKKPLGELALQASFTALPTLDGNDGALVLCYRSYFPAANAAVY
ncbi:MAG TPA: hypothetical protein VKR59_05510 [Terriglobales bacterium]|nr:hypothetical protein [Terriglobales bacterium]